MGTPVIPKKQQRHSLSAKKTPIKGLRNVLAQPQDKYWPLVSAEKCSELEDLMKKLMQAIKRPSRAIPWSQLRHMKKEERVQAKKEALSKQENIPDKNIVDSVVFGINAATRSMEKNNVCCISVDANIEPPLLIKHIILMAQNKRIPILLVPALKKIILNTVGFASAVFALKDSVMKPDHHFHALFNNICDIFKDIPPPTNSLQLFSDIETEEIALNENDDINTEETKESPTLEPKLVISTDVYKYRSSRKERVFVPPTNTEESPAEKIDESNDFISISKYDSDEESNLVIGKSTRYVNVHEGREKKHNMKTKFQSNYKEFNKKSINKETDTMKFADRSKEINNGTANVKYLPLKVKRLQGNNNRVKATKASKQKKK